MSASIDQIVKLESKPKRPNSDYPREELKRRLQSGLDVINSSLTDEAMDNWFERGATKLDNGNFRINRDTKLNVSHYNPPIMGIDQMQKMHNVILESDIDVLHLHPTDPETLTGAPSNEIDRFREMTEDFVNKSIAKSGSEKDYVNGNHHFYVNNPGETAQKIIKFIS